MGGWMDGRMGGWTDGRMGGWADGQVEGGGFVIEATALGKARGTRVGTAHHTPTDGAEAADVWRPDGPVAPARHTPALGCI